MKGALGKKFMGLPLFVWIGVAAAGIGIAIFFRKKEGPSAPARVGGLPSDQYALMNGGGPPGGNPPPSEQLPSDVIQALLGQSSFLSEALVAQGSNLASIAISANQSLADIAGFSVTSAFQFASQALQYSYGGYGGGYTQSYSPAPQDSGSGRPSNAGGAPTPPLRESFTPFGAFGGESSRYGSRVPEVRLPSGVIPGGVFRAWELSQ